jgi:peroxidase
MGALSRAAMLATMGLAIAVAVMSARPSLATNLEGLSYDFHAGSCTDLEFMVRIAVENAIESDASIVAGLLQITYHDCFPQGCDGSILLIGEGSEQKMPQNAGLQQIALQLIESIRDTVHRACGPTVSCTDITNLATRLALMHSGVRGYLVPLGRYDRRGPATEEQVGILPGPDDSIEAIAQKFYQRGKFDLLDVVALSGAHTIGRASCNSFKNRKGENAEFVARLRRNCSSPFPMPQDLDIQTPHTFDNKYYENLLEHKGVLNSDMALVHHSYTIQMVREFARNEDWFLTKFSEAMQKMAHLEGEPHTLGEIRHNCFKINGNNGDTAAQGFAASA